MSAASKLKQSDSPRPTSEEIRAQISAKKREIREKRVTHDQRDPARNLLKNNSSPAALIAFDRETELLAAEIEIFEAASARLRDQLEQAQREEAEAQRRAFDAKLDALAADYENHVRKFFEAAPVQELRAALKIEEFYLANGVDISRLQAFREDRSRFLGSPETEKLLVEFLIDDASPHGVYEHTPEGHPIWGPRRVMRERVVKVPARPAEPLPELRSLLEEIRIPALMASDGHLWPENRS